MNAEEKLRVFAAAVRNLMDATGEWTEEYGDCIARRECAASGSGVFGLPPVPHDPDCPYRVAKERLEEIERSLPPSER